RPNAHRDRWNEHQHDQREPVVELVERRQVLVKKLVRPKRRGGRQEDEDTEKDVTGRVAEITDKVSLHHRERRLLAFCQNRYQYEQQEQESDVIKQQEGDG